MTSKGCHVRTRVPSSVYRFKWTVENFSKLSPEKTAWSPEFHPYPGSTWGSTLEKCPTYIRWEMISDYENNSSRSQTIVKQIKHFNFRVNDCIESCSTTESISYSVNKGIHVKHDISVVDSKGKVWLKKTVKNKYDCLNKKCSLIDSSDTIAYSEMNHLKMDVLTFCCLMTFTGDSLVTEMFEMEPEIPETVQDLKQLSKDLKLMYGVSLYTDVCLRVESEILRAHRAILSARSPVFNKMFDHKLEETETGTIDIVDLDVQVLKDLISYLYTGILLDESFDSVMSLYYAADKYDVSHLRKKCGQILQSKLTVDNACRVLVLADRHCDDILKKSVMAFIDIYLEHIMATEDWNDLVKNETKVAAEVLKARAISHCESKEQ